MQITVHAIEQYISRHRPGLTTVAAHAELRGLVATATRVERAPSGGDLYVCEGGLRIVVKHDRGPIVVTVVPPGGDAVVYPTVAAPEGDTDHDLRNAIHRYLHRQADAGDRSARRLLSRCSRLWT